MLNLVLASATPIVYMGYTESSLPKKLPLGKQILLDLFFSLLWSSLVYTLLAPTDFFSWIGFTITVENYGAMLSCCSLIFLLYIGPLVQTAFIEDEGSEFNLPEVKSYLTDPFCEELFFRTCLINCLLCAGLGTSGSLILSTGIFTIYKCRFMLQGLTIQNAIKNQKVIELARELTWTASLGCLLGFMYINTASLLAVVLVHIFKTFMGFPDLTFGTRGHQLYSKRFAIYTAYLIGLTSFLAFFKMNMLEYDFYHPWHSNLDI